MQPLAKILQFNFIISFQSPNRAILELLLGNDVRNKNMYQKRINFRISNEFSFKESFRINYQQAEFILQNIGDLIKHKTTKNKALTPKQQLLLCLHWLGNGCQYHGVGAMHGVTKGTVCTTVRRVCNAIVENLFPKIVCWPENVADIGPNFYIKGGFPNVCGCVDGTIINIDAPSSNEVMFVDRHGNHSLNVMMICGPNNLFYAVNANWPGSVHDSRVLRNSAVFHKFESGWRPFEGAVILGDSAYPLKNWLIPPINQNSGDTSVQNFNNAHKRTRRLVEDSFGILKEKFPCLNYLRLRPRTAAKIVLTCSTIHNIACTIAREYRSEDLLMVDGTEVTTNNNNLLLEMEAEHEMNLSAIEKLNNILTFFRQTV